MKNLQVKIVSDLKEEPVSIHEAKLFCRVTGDQEDELFLRLIISARRQLEKYTSSSFGEKTISAFWLNPQDIAIFELPYGPIISIDKVFRIGNDDITECRLNEDYFVYGLTEKIVSVNKFWSSSSSRLLSNNSIRIEYTAGYGGEDTAALPEELKLAVLKQVATDYELRENIVLDAATILNNESKRLAAPYRRKLWF